MQAIFSYDHFDCNLINSCVPVTKYIKQSWTVFNTNYFSDRLAGCRSSDHQR